MAVPVVQWVCRELSKLLAIDASEDIAKYLLAIESREELEEYLSELLDGNEPRHKKFIRELLTKWRPPTRQIDAPVNLQPYRKQDEDQTYVTGSAKSKKKGKKGGSSPGPSASDQTTAPSSQEEDSVSLSDGSGVTKGKGKFVPLFGEAGRQKCGAKLPGRHPCDCQASKHKLVSNCTKCGRVVCEQEGSGPCLFCGSLVCTIEELEVLNRGSKKSGRLRESLMSRGYGGMLQGVDQSLPHQSAKAQQDLEIAVEHKNKLIHYDRTSTKRTRVIDDESDYFSIDNRWLSKSDKEALEKREEELRKQRHQSRLERKVTLDFAGRQVLEAEEMGDMYDINDSVIRAVHFGEKAKPNGPLFTDKDFGDLVNPNIVQEAPKFIPSGNGKSLGKKAASRGSTAYEAKKALRIQDRELQEMSDAGMCLSMHQPWAHLLVKGIKIHEGRSWYTPHRGRLYIAATAKQPTPQEVAALEQQYRFHYNDGNIEFPNDYPIGCLLGSVDVVDCLAQEEYIKKFPNGESSSQYVFICENPQELLVKFPIKGKHKISVGTCPKKSNPVKSDKMDSHIHQAAKKGLQQKTAK